MRFSSVARSVETLEWTSGREVADWNLVPIALNYDTWRRLGLHKVK